MRDDGSPKAEAGAGLAACLWQRVEGARELAVGSELVRVLVRAVKERHMVTSRRLRTRPHVSSWTHGAFGGVWLGGCLLWGDVELVEGEMHMRLRVRA